MRMRDRDNEISNLYNVVNTAGRTDNMYTSGKFVKVSKINLKEYAGKSIKVYGQFERIGYDKKDCNITYVILRNVRDVHGKYILDHIWVQTNEQLLRIAAELKMGDTLKVEAVVSTYNRDTVHAWSYGLDTPKYAVKIDDGLLVSGNEKQSAINLHNAGYVKRDIIFILDSYHEKITEYLGVNPYSSKKILSEGLANLINSLVELGLKTADIAELAKLDASFVEHYICSAA